jgi:hypothetical protein
MSGTGKTHHAEAVCGDYVTGRSPSASRWIGLLTVGPADDGSPGTEVTTSGTSYGRQPITFGAGVDQTPTGRLYTNDLAAVWATATANYGTIQEWAIYDAVTAGNMLFHDAMPGTPTVNSGQTPSLPIGSVTYLED